ncbi:MAG: phosphoenolpyruvate synthase [Candidatus Pacearchaeota archaeon]
MVQNKYIRWLSELDKSSGNIAGGKGANLAEMFNAKFPVPPAFVITTLGYTHFINAANIKKRIDEILEKIDVDNTEELEKKAAEIRNIIVRAEMPEDLKEEILESYEDISVDKNALSTASKDALNILRYSQEPCFVAVRSSATTEDLSDASFAGQQETYLNIKGNKEILEAVKKVFASLFTARAIYYRKKKGFSKEKFSLAAVVQKMVDSDKSGVIFSKNPVSERDTIIIEAVFGLGEGIVSGRIKPDTYEVSKELYILDKKISEKKIAITRNSQGENVEVKLTDHVSKAQVIEDSMIKQLANIAQKIEDHYGKPQDIEFAIENDEIFIVQSRPITTKSKAREKEIKVNPILKGLGASPGISSGTVKIIHNLNELSKIQKGDVLVTEMTNPDMVVSMQKASAIITDEGGLTSHAAIVSREMGIPAIVGTGNATTFLKEGQKVTVDGYRGEIYEGITEEQKVEILPIVKTKTKIKVIVDIPDAAERAAKSKAEAVGLLRIEGIIASGEKHPLYFQKNNKLNEYTGLLEKGISKISEHFNEIWIRTSDIRTDEFKNLEGAPKETEGNPMLGMHGIRFSLKNDKILRAEFNAIKNCAITYSNKIFGVMFPQIISVEEVIEAKKIAKEHGLMELKNIKIGIMVETPAACFIIKHLLKTGLDFISFGTNDLTQYILAIDRNNEEVQYLYNEKHPAVLNAIKRVLRTCQEFGVESSICGQAGSNKEMVRFLIENGISSVSVNADAAHEISKYITELEKNMPHKNHERKKNIKKNPKDLIEDITKKAEYAIKEELQKHPIIIKPKVDENYSNYDYDNYGEIKNTDQNTKTKIPEYVAGAKEKSKDDNSQINAIKMLFGEFDDSTSFDNLRKKESNSDIVLDIF